MVTGRTWFTHGVACLLEGLMDIAGHFVMQGTQGGLNYEAALLLWTGPEFLNKYVCCSKLITC